MIILKNYFVGTTQHIDFVPIIHDVRLTIRDSQLSDGLVTIHTPKNGAGLIVTPLSKEQLEEVKEKFKDLESLHTSLSLPFQKKELVLDPKQMIYLVDVDSTAKRREFYVQLLGDTPPAQQPPGGRRRP